jgi:hypothetical protein
MGPVVGWLAVVAVVGWLAAVAVVGWVADVAVVGWVADVAVVGWLAAVAVDGWLAAVAVVGWGCVLWLLLSSSIIGLSTPRDHVVSSISRFLLSVFIKKQRLCKWCCLVLAEQIFRYVHVHRWWPLANTILKVSRTGFSNLFLPVCISISVFSATGICIRSIYKV